MKITRTIFVLLFLTGICRAQTITISGVVKSSDGAGMDSVSVRLGKTDIATLTGPDGKFTLKRNSTNIASRSNQTVFCGNCPFSIEGNEFLLSGTGQTDVKVTVYDCNGKLLFSHGKSASQATHSLTLPHLGCGVYFLRVAVNNEQFIVKDVSGVASNHFRESSRNDAGLAMQAKTAGTLDDALLFTKDGYQLFRIAVTKPDTSGIQVTMNPLVTGTVTDGEGNVYKTVQIGTQEWTTENLRATKFNDNTNIGSGCQFYTNVTDAAAKKKWGALYDWATVKTGKLAPKGWHIPANTEWDTLVQYLISHGYAYDGTTDTVKAKRNKIAKSLCAKTDWQKDSADTGAIGNDLSRNNSTGFSALPAGWRDWNGNIFDNQLTNGYWWTSTAKDGTYSWVYEMWNIDDHIVTTYMTLIMCSVRLAKDR